MTLERDSSERLCENIRDVLTCGDPPEREYTAGDMFAKKVISNVYVFRARVVDRTGGERNGTRVVGMNDEGKSERLT